MGFIKEKINGVQRELYVYGRAISDNSEHLEEIVKVLEDAGYVIARAGDSVVVITKYLEEVANEQ